MKEMVHQVVHQALCGQEATDPGHGNGNPFLWHSIPNVVAGMQEGPGCARARVDGVEEASEGQKGALGLVRKSSSGLRLLLLEGQHHWGLRGRAGQGMGLCLPQGIRNGFCRQRGMVSTGKWERWLQ